MHSPAQLRRHMARLEECIARIERLDPSTMTKRYGEPQLVAIEAEIEQALEAAFGERTTAYNRFREAATLDHGPHTMRLGPALGSGAHIDYGARDAMEAQKYVAEGKPRSIALLRTAIGTLKNDLADQEAEHSSITISEQIVAKANSRKVFVVHGHDNEAKNEVARFLSKIGLEEIILHERPNIGRHLLTKFQEESEGAGFAVILMTPDDEAGALGTPPRKRARQNVVFELGFFIGRLGAPYVAALVKGDIEKPSDFDGVAYIELDAKGAWKGLLARELQAVNIPFDPAKVFSA
ncbi:MAG: nucleotide-binding protein [Methylovirgula sp.]